MLLLQNNLLHIFTDTKRKKEWEENCKARAEKKRVSWAVRQEKGNLLEGKERMTGS